MEYTTTHQERESLVVSFCETSILDQSQVELIEGDLKAITDGALSPRILIDLQNVDFLSSAMIGVFIRFKSNSKSKGLALKLCNAKPELKKLLKVTQLDRVFEVYESREHALDAFHGLRN